MSNLLYEAEYSYKYGLTKSQAYLKHYKTFFSFSARPPPPPPASARGWLSPQLLCGSSAPCPRHPASSEALCCCELALWDFFKSSVEHFLSMSFEVPMPCHTAKGWTCLLEREHSSAKFFVTLWQRWFFLVTGLFLISTNIITECPLLFTVLWAFWSWHIGYSPNAFSSSESSGITMNTPCMEIYKFTS